MADATIDDLSSISDDMDHRERIRSIVAEEPEDPLIDALNRLSHGSKFLWLIFILTITPTIFNGMHSVIYVFIAEIPTHWCKIPELKAANWTYTQIHAIAQPSDSCMKYDYDYAHLASLGYDEAKKYVDGRDKPATLHCYERDFADDTDATSIVEEWDLVCESLAYRSSTQMAISLGKLIGGGFFGVFSDKYGRRTSYRIGIVLMMITGPAMAIIPWFWAYMILRFVNGVSHAAITYSSFTILCEVADEQYRQWMGIAYNTGYASGVVIIPIIAYFLRSWKHIQLVSSLPAIACIAHLWLMPESPRWLITRNRRDDARDLMEKALENTDKPGIEPDPIIKTLRISRASIPKIDFTQLTTKEKIQKQLMEIGFLVTNGEMGRRLLITNFAWLSASLSYYALALNADNLSANRYVYMMIMGLSDIPAYILPAGILMLFGRRQSSTSLYIIAGIFLLIILVIPTDFGMDIAGIALLARFILSAAYGIVILYTSELFPTVVRNSAVGVNSTMSHVGSVIAPYLTDLLGAIIWWGPTTVCGILAVSAGLLIGVLPETRGRTMVNTLDEDLDGEREECSVGNLVKC